MIIVAMQNTDETKEPRLWVADGWTAKVLKNEDDDGWAVAMIKDGEPEPALIGPWTMGRDKKNPKPLDVNAFNTLVKTASEFVRRHEQQLHAELHQSVTVTAASARVTVNLDIVPDEDNPYATLSAYDEVGALLAEVRTAASFKLSRASAERWAASNFEKPT
jgi:sulfur carrier protein ThiS